MTILNLIYQKDLKVELINKKLENLQEILKLHQGKKISLTPKEKLKKVFKKLGFLFAVKKEYSQKKHISVKTAASNSNRVVNSDHSSTNKLLLVESSKTKLSLIEIKEKNINQGGIKLRQKLKTKRETFVTVVRMTLKGVLGTFFIFTSWVFITIFLKALYSKFREKMFEICVAPMISMLVTNLLVVEVIMISVFTLLSWITFELKFFGVTGLIYKVFSIVINPLIQIQHKSLIIAKDLSHLVIFKQNDKSTGYFSSKKLSDQDKEKTEKIVYKGKGVPRYN